MIPLWLTNGGILSVRAGLRRESFPSEVKHRRSPINLTKLEGLQLNAALRGVLRDEVVTVASVGILTALGSCSDGDDERQNSSAQ